MAKIRKIFETTKYFIVKNVASVVISPHRHGVMRCFSLDLIGAAKMRVNRLLKDHLVEKIDDFVDNGTTKARYRKYSFMTQ